MQHSKSELMAWIRFFIDLAKLILMIIFEIVVAVVLFFTWPIHIYKDNLKTK